MAQDRFALLPGSSGGVLMRVLVTGSRDLVDAQPVYEALWVQANKLASITELTVVEGGARGADFHARMFCREYGAVNETYPADWETYGKAAGHIRNAIMVASKPDLCLAFPRGVSKGTWNCVYKAREAKIPVIIG